MMLLYHVDNVVQIVLIMYITMTTTMIKCNSRIW